VNPIKGHEDTKANGQLLAGRVSQWPLAAALLNETFPDKYFGKSLARDDTILFNDEFIRNTKHVFGGSAKPNQPQCARRSRFSESVSVSHNQGLALSPFSQDHLPHRAAID
jgi:hypothetical protein